MQPHDVDAAAGPFLRAIRSVSRRLFIFESVHALAIASAVVAVALLILNATRISNTPKLAIAAIAGAAALTGWLTLRRHRWSPEYAARAVERAVPASRNLVVTAEELVRCPERARTPIRTRVFKDASQVTGSLLISRAVPLGRPLLLLVGAIVAVLLIGARAREPLVVTGREATTDNAGRGGASSPLRVVATIVSPAYVGVPPRTIEEPERLEALEGSRLKIETRGSGAAIIRFGADPLPVVNGASEITLSSSGYLAIEPGGPDAGRARRLIPVTVTPDRAPAIRVEVPAKDLLLPNATSTVPVSAVATDDFGLRSLELLYTKVSGSGEQFEFKEGSIPLAINNSDSQAWSARGALALPTLALAPGDSLIYRFVGRDLRPGDVGLAASDTFFVEIAGPGQVALEGFEMPPDRERYALSQQMVVLKLERLRARERGLDRSTLESEVATIAAEQRAVRANFIFLTGGTVEDEAEEAEHSHEIQEGRLENTARQEISRAIQHMGRVEQALAAISTGDALPPAKAAVEALQRAFGRNRYFLRTLPVRSRIDPASRLSGELSSATDWKRELSPNEPDGSKVSARDLLARAVELAPEIRARSLPPNALTALAESALTIDPASAEWQSISSALLSLRDDPNLDEAARNDRLNTLVASIAAQVQKHAPVAAPASNVGRSLSGAWQLEQERR